MLSSRNCTYFRSIIVNPLPHIIRHFNALKIINIAMENIVRKGEIACNKQFLLFSQCFLPYMVRIFHFKCTLKCGLYGKFVISQGSIGPVLTK